MVTCNIWGNVCFARTRLSKLKLINERFLVVCCNRCTLLFCHRYEQVHNTGEPEQFPTTCIQSAAVGPECITLFPKHHSSPNLSGSPRGQPQETDRPEAQHYVIMTSECCPVLCWADREDGWTGAVTGDHQPHESCVWAVQLWIIAVSSQRAASAA